MMINTKKMLVAIIIATLISILLVAENCVFDNLETICFICNAISFIFIFILYKFTKNNFFVFIFGLLLLLFSNGCCLLVSMGVDVDTIYIFRVSKFSEAKIVKSFVFNTLCLGMFALGVVATSKQNTVIMEPNIINKKNIERGMFVSGAILFFVFMPFDFYFAVRKMIASANRGFLYLYSEDYLSGELFSFIKNYTILVVPGAFLLSFSSKNQSKYSYWLPIVYLLISATIILLSGDRAYPFGIYIAIAWYVVQNRKQNTKKINFKTFVTILILGFVGVSMMSFMSDYRLEIDKNVGDFISGFFNYLITFKALISGINETGISIRPLLELQILMDRGSVNQLYGASLLGAIIMLIPKFMRGNLYEIGIMNNWIGMEYVISDFANVGGLGYSLQAEAYSNFLWFGWMFFFFWGIIVNKCLSFNAERSREFNYVKRALLPGLFSAFVILTRQSSSLFLQYLLIYLFAPYVMTRLLSIKNTSNTSRALTY